MKKEGHAAAGMLALLARTSIYKILAVLAAMAAVQAGFFYGRIKDMSAPPVFEGVWMETGGAYVFYVAFCAVFGILLWTQGEHGGRSRYTLLRLPLTWRQILFLRIFYNLLCFLLLFAVQIWMIFGLEKFFSAVAGPEYVTGQTVFLAFYRIPLLHNILPMAETGKWIRNLLMLLAFSLEAAAGHRRRGYMPAVMLVIVMFQWAFGSETGFNLRDVFCVLILLIVIGGTLWGMRKSEEEREDGES
ncbi:MAG: hypothetical protein NC541_11530 [bacterium]|nr:hypothetical protein [bacterium]